jgi:catechol 2,3-dioxygenase-like lactoylglutathione lyase family enzyme
VPTFRTPQVVLLVADVEAAAAFYRRFGFVERFRTPASGTPIHVDLALDGTVLGLASIDSTRDDHGIGPIVQGMRAAVVIWTDDVAQAIEELSSEGVEVLRRPYRWLDRLTVAWVSDPDGHAVQLVQGG